MKIKLKIKIQIKKMNQKINDVITIFLIQLVISLPFYATNVYGLAISNVKVTKVTQNSATIEWDTDNNSSGKVSYGKTIPLGLSQKHDNFVENHNLTIFNADKNTTYFFNVESSDKTGNSAMDNNSGKFYAFKTLEISEISSANIQDSGPPQINLSLPRYLNRRSIDIIGTTRQFSSVALFVNNLNFPKRILSSNEAATGKFAFSQIQLEQENVIKIAVEDRSGNKNEKTFEVSVDTESPIVKLSNITSLTSKPNLTISGNVNEQAAIKVFVDTLTKEASAPPKIKGLNTTKIGQNSIELKWEESKDKDFSHYVVYRDDTAIALTQPANYNLFIDPLVDSGKEYKYEVSAVNTFGKEGPKSEPIAAKTLQGGAILNLKHPSVDIFEDFRKPLFAINATDNFNFGVRLNKGDGIYSIKLVFEDKAGNKAAIEKIITLDTKKPEVKIISPPAGAFIFENVAHEVDIIGKTKPNARVHLFIDRTPLSSFDTSAVVTGLPNEAQNIRLSTLDVDVNKIENISEAELESRCKSNIPRALCKSGADRSETADKEGNFKFEKVDLTAAFALATRLTQVPVTQFRDVQLNPEARESKKANILVIATDATGQRGLAAQTVGIGTCWSGNQSWDVISLSKYQSPTFLSTERMAEGTETLYFYFNYSYIGRGSNPKIKSVSLSKACSTREIIDPRFNISCSVLPAGNSPTKLNSEGTLTYSAIPLNRFEGMDRFLEADWKSFLKAINSELTFPFQARVNYEHDVLDDNGQYKRVTETQTTCQELSYVVDNTLIDPRKVLPDWLLYNFVDYLQDAIKALTKVQEQIDRTINYVGQACLYTFFAHLVYKIYRTWTDLINEKIFILKTFAFNTGNTQDDQDCKLLAEKIAEAYGSGNIKNLKLKYFSDPDLKKCFPSSYSAWQNEAKFYQWQRWSCDRIFGHSSPSRWTETQSDDDLQAKITSQKSCQGDGDVKGKPIQAENCRKLVASQFTHIKPEEYNLDDKCFMIGDGKSKALYRLGNNVEGNIYELNFVPGSGSRIIELSYAIRRTDTQFITAQPQTCAELCGENTKEKTEEKDIDGKKYVIQKGEFKQAGAKKDISPQEALAKIRLGACVTVNECRAWHAKAKPEKGGIEIPGLITDEKGNILPGIIKDYSIQRKGYAKNCFYDGTDASVVSDLDADRRQECCCIIGKSSIAVSSYYEPKDTDKKLNAIYPKQNPFVHESKTIPSSGPQPKAQDSEGFSDMKWSYRYSRIGYLDKKYNPYRYIEGRDLPACFGQDNRFYFGLKDKEETLVLNPFQQHTAALQCAYLTGINQRLQLMKNIMTALSNCLIEVRQNGRSDAGVCKELFTQHVCGLIWQAVRFFIDGCNPDEIDVNAEDKEEGFGEKIKLGFKGIAQGITEAQSELSEEYGNAKLNNLLGIGEGGVARKVCLGAFGYDWGLSARNLIDAAYSAPFATLVQAVTRSREFLTVNPETLMPKYEYRASWLVNPGCELERYDVQLACVSRKELDEYPNQIKCGAVGAPSILTVGQAPGTGPSTSYNQCDCLNLAQEVLEPFSYETNLKQNVLSEKDRHLVVERQYRFDHLKFTLRTDRRILPNIKPNCFSTGFEKGVFYFPITDRTAYDITDCTVDPISGVFSCGSGTAFFSRKGT